LDWDWPEFPPAERPGSTAEVEKAEVLVGERADPLPAREEETRRLIERYRREVAAAPNNLVAANDLAWAYLTAPPALRDLKAAVPLAEKALRLEPGTPFYRNTLGLAYYRAGRYREAVDVLRPNLDKQSDIGLAFDLYFLAMSHHRLGDTARARDYLTLAV